jgi:hypothetical protein
MMKIFLDSDKKITVSDLRKAIQTYQSEGNNPEEDGFYHGSITEQGYKDLVSDATFGGLISLKQDRVWAGLVFDSKNLVAVIE